MNEDEAHVLRQNAAFYAAFDGRDADAMAAYSEALTRLFALNETPQATPEASRGTSKVEPFARKPSRPR